MTTTGTDVLYSSYKKHILSKNVEEKVDICKNKNM